ncbi:MAG: metal dependent phosphohydrolase [Clostridiales bacterium]|jgi:putative nucleotidyltransferase with HDIG domain|nr:metal dependent phosphohydrolase [Clostridiales bacterium]
MKLQDKNATNQNTKRVTSILLMFLVTITALAGVAYNLGISNTYSTTKQVSLLFLTIILLGVLVVYLYTMSASKIFTMSKQLICFVVYEIIIVCITFLVTQSYLMLPILIAPMLIALVVDIGFALVSNMFFSIFASLLFVDNRFEILIFYLLGGSIAALLIKYTKSRKNIAVVAGILIIVNVTNVLLLDLYIYDNFYGMHFLLALLNAGLSVIITIGMLPLFETVFDVVTPSKLLEFSNIDQPLIKRLLNEAPGTFHHSQMVASLSEKAAMDIDADHQLARVASLYHDIGKLKRPEYFIENQEDGINPHDELAPENSAMIILSHVSDGMILANEYKLPTAIKNIIKQHQGDALLRYFYNKAKNGAVGNEIISEDTYSYRGPKPQTREAAVVMLADSTEAAIKAIPIDTRSLENMEEMISNVIKTRFQEGQLDESNLTINELNVIAKAFLQVYKGKDHTRNIKKL